MRRRKKCTNKTEKAATAGANTTTSHPCFHVPQLLTEKQQHT